ncbi:MAG: hypothetical protein EAZ30_00930 [Betaproteobacteria bacterium]|nr:MAG: hypothetical protein EAZ30_00930 [Betaproteobacteria bacterium]
MTQWFFRRRVFLASRRKEIPTTHDESALKIERAPCYIQAGRRVGENVLAGHAPMRTGTCSSRNAETAGDC